MGKNKRNKIVSLILSLILCTTLTNMIYPADVSAGTSFISVNEFIKRVVNELNLTKKKDYIETAVDVGIIKEGEFSTYTKNLTRTDAAIILNRADEYLYGDKLSPELVKMALEKRISDIKDVKSTKRLDVAKCYLKGYIEGYSNGSYSTNRAFKGNSKISKDSALKCIKMLKNKSLRAKISPDGQLIRTTNLPKNAKSYPYILASYPNEYYEKSFAYEGVTQRINGKIVPMKNIEDYASPKDVDKTEILKNNKNLKKENLNTWVEKSLLHTSLIFNVNYKSIGKEWSEKLLTTHYYFKTDGYEDIVKEEIRDYIKSMKKNKVIIDCNKVAVDGSSLYFFDGSYYLRAYVRYRIVSCSVSPNLDSIFGHPYNNVLFSRMTVDLRGYSLGKWEEGYFDISLSRGFNSYKDMAVVYVDIDAYKGGNK